MKNMESRLSIGVNRFLHIAFVLLGLYFLTLSEDTGSAAANFGISLAFDPFNADQPFTRRPLWQKAWLLLLVTVTLLGIVAMFTR
jgi:hypothetical protein